MWSILKKRKKKCVVFVLSTREVGVLNSGIQLFKSVIYTHSKFGSVWPGDTADYTGTADK